MELGSLPFVPPLQLSGGILLEPPHARAIFLHNDLLCNGTCSVSGGRITYRGGGTNGKDSKYVKVLAIKLMGSFPFVSPPSLVGAFYLHPLGTCHIYTITYYVMTRAP